MTVLLWFGLVPGTPAFSRVFTFGALTASRTTVGFSLRDKPAALTFVFTLGALGVARNTVLLWLGREGAPAFTRVFTFGPAYMRHTLSALFGLCARAMPRVPRLNGV